MKRGNGFSLVELMIAMAISGIVMTAIYTAYSSQQKSYIAQDQITVMQQGLRGGIYYLQREIRMAGHDPTQGAGATIVTANANSIRFTMDIGDGIDNDGDGSTDESDEILFADGVDNDGDGNIDEPDEILVDGGTGNANEDIAYSLYDSGGDGIMDLGRATGGGANSMVAENIQALGFAYAYDDDGNGQLDTSGGSIIWAIDSDGDGDLDLNLDTDTNGVIDINDNAAGSAIAPNVNLNSIRAVKVWILARAERGDDAIYNNTTYVISNQRITPNDSIRRRLLTTTVRCMNMGL
ncbi:MAG: prepilin-type N-terminal cleavage/methylation domain-containing protein [Deltaproteobacteria bacterium]|nr:prepilin-type N-terminal cleavage/methylation domain-containing protein [Deltaproteobacteria bacterium]